MIFRFDDYKWNGSEVSTYKNEPGTWQDVTRCVLMPELASKFQLRYFEVAPGGYTSYERHEHEHAVVVVRGKGQVRLGNEWHEIGLLDGVRVSSQTPHQFRNPHAEPFGIFCIVDSDRDRPIFIDPQSEVCTSK